MSALSKEAESAIAGRCCADAKLQQFLDETLTGERRAALETHVDQCGACQQRLEVLCAPPWASSLLSRVARSKEYLRRA